MNARLRVFFVVVSNPLAPIQIDDLLAGSEGVILVDICAIALTLVELFADPKHLSTLSNFGVPGTVADFFVEALEAAGLVDFFTADFFLVVFLIVILCPEFEHAIGALRSYIAICGGYDRRLLLKNGTFRAVIMGTSKIHSSRPVDEEPIRQSPENSGQTS